MDLWVLVCNNWVVSDVLPPGACKIYAMNPLLPCFFNPLHGDNFKGEVR